MRFVLNSLVKALQRKEICVLGAIVHKSGSAPRTSGARMLVLADGTLVGSVGGGALEGASLTRAKTMLTETENYAELNFELTATAAAEAGMVCGGDITVLLMKIGPESLELFRRLEEDFLDHKRCLLVTVLPQQNTPPHLILLNEDINSELPEKLQQELLRKPRRAPFLMKFENQELFVEPIFHPGTVYLVGAGHVALATAQCANFVGFDVVVMDDRAEFANEERYPQAQAIHVLNDFNNCFQELGPDDYVVIVTRGHLHDREVLCQALRTGAGYIGMIGSRRKRDAVYSSLLEEGFSEAELERVHCPIGLGIGADTPEEIALSIVAEIVGMRAGAVV